MVNPPCRWISNSLALLKGQQLLKRIALPLLPSLINWQMMVSPELSTFLTNLASYHLATDADVDMTPLDSSCRHAGEVRAKVVSEPIYGVQPN